MGTLVRYLLAATAVFAFAATPAAASASAENPQNPAVAVDQGDGMDAERLAGIGGAILLLAAMIQRDGRRDVSRSR